MNFLTIFLQTTEATGTTGSAQNPWMMPMMLVLIFVVMYFFMIRPQQKRQKEVAKFRNALEKGQKVVTIGGVYGTIKEIKENKVLVEVDTNVTIWFDKSAISRDPSEIGGQR